MTSRTVFGLMSETDWSDCIKREKKKTENQEANKWSGRWSGK